MTVRILAFSASLRRASLNTRLVTVAAQGARDAGAEVTLLNLNDYPLPIFNADDEAANGLPDNARKLKQMFREHDGYMISSPEYNGGFPGVLKNLTEWMSRREGDEKPFSAWEDKPVVTMAASPGALGGNRMMASLRAHLLHMRMIVIPDVLGLPKADQMLGEDGSVADEATRARIENLGQRIVHFARLLKTQ
jgi:chromate reductase, NAD(P)H dehydrogenase (quinone)